MQPMTTEKFSKLTARDFQNGAVRDEIYAALKQRERLLAQAIPSQSENEMYSIGDVMGFKNGDRKISGIQVVMNTDGSGEVVYDFDDGGETWVTPFQWNVGGEHGVDHPQASDRP